MKIQHVFALLVLNALPALASAQPPTAILLKPERLFDGVSGEAQTGKIVLVKDNKIMVVAGNDVGR